jgi:glucosyl-dolichyl phosphate glucuronosyltransferase
VTPAISVVVCTLDQAGYLRKALGSLRGQSLPRPEYEVIVVDNGSTDSTKQTVESSAGMENLRYFYDPVLGLSHARNTGWRAARGEYIAYLDDDALASPDWLERIRDRFETLRPRPASVGGRILPIWEAEKPSWLTRELERHLSIVDWQSPAMFLDDDRFYLAGSNVSYRRSVLQESGGFPESLGRKGRRLRSNEELWMQSFLRSRGQAVWYDPAIVVHHHIKARRLTPAWFYERFFWQGVSDALLENHVHGRRGKQRPRLSHLWEESSGTAGDLVGYIKSLLSGNTGVVSWCRIQQRLGKMVSKTFPGFGR